MGSLVGQARGFLASRPPLVKASLTSGCIMMLGDVLVQQVTAQPGQPRRLDLARVARFGVVGATLHGPYFSSGMRKIDQIFGASRSVPTVIKKTVTSQATLFPPFVALLFGWVGILEGKSLEQCKQKIKSNYKETFVVGCFFWPAANLINFRFIEPHQRILYVSCAGLVWNTFISWKNANSNKDDEVLRLAEAA